MPLYLHTAALQARGRKIEDENEEEETRHNSLLADIIKQMPEPDDITLLKQYAEGDESAFTTPFERYFHLIYSTALRQVRNPSHGEEIAQARLPVFRHWPSPKPLVLP